MSIKRSMTFERTIAAPASDVFAIVADIANTARWLPGSAMFGGVKDVTPDPVCLGTTFVDYGRLGKRYGSVIDFVPDSFITFHQPMDFKAPVPGRVDVRVRYTFEPLEGRTRVVRRLEAALDIAGPGQLLAPFVFASIRRENERIMSALKKHAESPPSG